MPLPALAVWAPRILSFGKWLFKGVAVAFWAWCVGEYACKRWDYYTENFSEYYELINGFIDFSWATVAWNEFYPYFQKGIWFLDRILIWDTMRVFIAGFVAVFCVAVFLRLFMAARNFMAGER